MATKSRSVRFDPELYVWVRAIAAAERRSFDQQVNWVLERWIAEYRAEHPEFELPEEYQLDKESE